MSRESTAPAGDPQGLPPESSLAAGALELLAQPGRWPAWHCPPATPALAAAQPWTAYWATRLDPQLDVRDARACLAAALPVFGARGDRVGELLCLAALIEDYYVDEGPLEPLDHWIELLVERLPPAGQWPSAELEARVMACGIAIRLRAPSHPLLAGWAERGDELLRRLEPGAGRLRLATFLAQYHLWRGEFERTGLIVDAVPGLSAQGLLPAEALVWFDTVANYGRYCARFELGRAAIEASLQLVQRLGLRQRRYALHAYGASLALAAHELGAAQRHVQAMREVLDSGVQADQTHYWHYLAGLTLLRGDAPRAVELARTALQNSGEIGGPTRLATHRLSLGQALLCSGDPMAALENVEAALGLASRIDAALMLFTAGLMRSACLRRLGRDAEATLALRSALREGARRDFKVTAVWWLPEVMGELLRTAIEQGIELAYARRLARLHRLPGPDPALAQWPWPLVLRSFGEFELWLHERCVTHGAGKTAQRPLDLLRALLAHGAAPLPVAAAMQWLWPEAEPAAQRKAFDAALLRLRRLLGEPGLLHLENGRLWLDEQRCWSDVGALHALLQRIGAAPSATGAQLQDWAGRLLDLMRGPFLSAEDADWAQAARERYRQRFVVAVAQLAARLEPIDADAAALLYQRALDIEPLAESLSRRLIRLHAARGDYAEALRSWRTCCTMLRAAGGPGPARETRALAAELGLPGDHAV